MLPSCSCSRATRLVSASLGGLPLRRFASSGTRWKARQQSDVYTKEAKLQGLKSRAAFKLLEINDKYRIFKKGNTVVDLGYAPGSWSQVALNRTAPNGRVVGIDVIPAQPPPGVSTIQGNFLSSTVQEEVTEFLRDPRRGRPQKKTVVSSSTDASAHGVDPASVEQGDGAAGQALQPESDSVSDAKATGLVDVVLSDMSAPWEQSTGLWKRSFSDPYNRMMNASGNGLRDHIGSMGLCMAALTFCYNNLKPGGNFVCKFYQGPDAALFEKRVKHLFKKFHIEKPPSSRKESREAYIVALKRLGDATREKVLEE